MLFSFLEPCLEPGSKVIPGEKKLCQFSRNGCGFVSEVPLGLVSHSSFLPQDLARFWEASTGGVAAPFGVLTGLIGRTCEAAVTTCMALWPHPRHPCVLTCPWRGPAKSCPGLCCLQKLYTLEMFRISERGSGTVILKYALPGLQVTMQYPAV